MRRDSPRVMGILFGPLGPSYYLCTLTVIHNVMHLHFRFLFLAHQNTPFNGFSHTIRSLRLTCTSFEIFDLVCSFPLLEDLALVDIHPGDATAKWSAPSSSPKLTGSLDLSSAAGIRLPICRLMGLPDGLRFAKITASCLDGDFESMSDLVSRCSDTLEYLNLYCSNMSEFPPAELHDRSAP